MLRLFIPLSLPGMKEKTTKAKPLDSGMRRNDGGGEFRLRKEEFFRVRICDFPPFFCSRGGPACPPFASAHGATASSGRIENRADTQVRPYGPYENRNHSFINRNSPPTGATSDSVLALPTIPHFSIGIDPQGGSGCKCIVATRNPSSL